MGCENVQENSEDRSSGKMRRHRAENDTKCLSAGFQLQSSDLGYEVGDTLRNHTIFCSQSSSAPALGKHMNNWQIGLKQVICNEVPTYSVGISKGLIKKDFILLEEEFCAQVTSKA